MKFSAPPVPTWPDTWSPSSLNVLSSCGLRSAFDLDDRFRTRFKRDSTYSILGTAAHELTKKVWSGEFNAVPNGDLATALRNEWNSLVEAGRDRLVGQWSPADVPGVVDWPYFSVRTRATVRRLTDEIASRRARTKGAGHGAVRVEKSIVDVDLRLKGTPDRVILTGNGFYVLDLKTGNTLDTITSAFRRQLLIYAHLVSTTTSEPLLGVGVLTANGEVIWGDAHQGDVDDVVNEIREMVARFRDVLTSGDLESLANPNPETCHYCPYRGVCARYWNDEGHDWMEYRGVVGRVVTVTDSRTFSVQQILPHDSAGQIVGVSNCVHQVQVGDMVSVVDGSRRGNSVRGNWYTDTVILPTV